MSLRAGRVGVRPDQVDAQGRINGTSPGPGPGPTPSAGHTYSLTEQEVGKWIDGKTIYELVVPLTSNQATLDFEIDTLIHSDAVGGTDSGNKWCLNSVTGLNNRAMYYAVETKKIVVASQIYFCTHAIIQYTKKEVSQNG